MRNGDVIDVDGVSYDSIQNFANRRLLHYQSVLLVMDVTNIIGENIFTCIIKNSRGSISHDISTNLTGIYMYNMYFKYRVYIAN